MKPLAILSLLCCLAIAGCPQGASIDNQDTLTPPENQQDLIPPGGDDNNQGADVGNNDNGSDSGSASNNDQSQDSGSGDDSPPPDDSNNPPPATSSEIPGGEYAGMLMADARLESRSTTAEQELEAPHIGNPVRISDDGLPYVSDRWVSDGGGVAEEGLTTLRLIIGPDTVHLVRMTIASLEINSDAVTVHWEIDSGSPYTCDSDTCVDTYEYNGQSLAVTTNVQLRWDADGSTQTLTVTGTAALTPR
jgi:hypothetical protein